IAGMQTGHTTSDRIIECPGEPSPSQWPDCWIYKQSNAGHSWSWDNNGRNALKGSCNIYFSHLADEIEAHSLQHWLYEFGYGHILLSSPTAVAQSEFPRNLNQSPGIISSRTPDSKDLSLEELPPIRDIHKKLFGIGQANLRVTPLQVATSMAAIAKGGIVSIPKLFKDMHVTESNPLGITPETMEVIYDGMHAVVNESQGTAYNEFSTVLESFAEQDVKIYGKTGSTEKPFVAWFAGFAQDSSGKILSLAIVVENGQHGSSDAAPLIRDILQYCIDLGYIGDSTIPTF
ncbi:penicillin-binding transpeptidase domain-containing protein, partial [Planctomycetota bacterium]